MPIRQMTLKWMGPFTMDQLDYAVHPGFYAIVTFRNGVPNHLLYIGQATDDTIKRRLTKHKSKWFDEHRGIRIYIACLTPEDHIYLGSDGILCIENALIYKYDPERNKDCRYYLKPKFGYHMYLIKNTGKRPFGFSPILDMQRV